MLCSYHSSDGEGSFEMDGIILFYSVLTKKKKISYSPDFDNFKILFFFLYSERRKRKNFLFSSSLKLGLRYISLWLHGSSPPVWSDDAVMMALRLVGVGSGQEGLDDDEEV